MRSIYEVRERPSRMYSWTALVASQILTELPWNILGSSIFFLCWYWTVGFDSSRAGYTYLMYGVVFPLYYTTIGQVRRYLEWTLHSLSDVFIVKAVASMAPSAEIAAILFSLLFSFVIMLWVFNMSRRLSARLTLRILAMEYCNHSGHSAGGNGCK